MSDEADCYKCDGGDALVLLCPEHAAVPELKKSLSRCVARLAYVTEHLDFATANHEAIVEGRALLARLAASERCKPGEHATEHAEHATLEERVNRKVQQVAAEVARLAPAGFVKTNRCSGRCVPGEHHHEPSEPHESPRLTAFLDAQPDKLTQARRRSILTRPIIINGVQEPRAVYIERCVGEGSVIWHAEKQRVLKHPNGTYMRESEISKVALDFAAWLIERKGEP